MQSKATNRMSGRNAPKWFNGTAEEGRINIDSHTWVLVDHCKFYGISGPVEPPESIVCAVCGVPDGSGIVNHCDNSLKPDFVKRYWEKK
jgi:hypothetical protein